MNTATMPARTIAATPRDLAVNGLVLGFAGAMWLGWGQDGAPAGWVVPLAVCSAVGLLVAVVGVIRTWQYRRGDSAMSQPQGRRTYRRVVGLEAVAIAAGGTALGVTGHTAYTAVWVLFIVGLHFVPLGRLFRIQSLAVVGVLAVLASVGAAISGLTGTAAPTAVAGGVGGILLIVFGAWSLLVHQQAAR